MPVYLYAWVEDSPSAAVARALVRYTNQQFAKNLRFKEGFPTVTHGFGNIKKSTPAYLQLARKGSPVLILTDLDNTHCSPTLIRDWLNIPAGNTLKFPKEFIFRVAVRETEAWLLADRPGLSRFLGISAANFDAQPEKHNDPKQYLLNVLRNKGRKRWHQDMLPQGCLAAIGPRYNEKLCSFIDGHWDPARAAGNAPSLLRALKALARI